MDRRQLLKRFVFTGVSAAVAAENICADPTPDHEAKVEKAIADSPFAGAPLPNYIDRRPHADYDLIHIAKGATVPEMWHFFAIPVGLPAPGACRLCGNQLFHSLDIKNFLMTNMLRAQSFPPPEARMVERIVFLFSPRMNEQDRNNLVTRTYWEFQLDQKIVGRAPLARTPTEGELSSLITFEGESPVKRVSRNDNKLSPSECLHLEKPVLIAPMQYFSFKFYIQPFVAADDIDLYVLLDGTGDFCVQ